jgi:predicted ATPase with chaperone activity
LSIANHGRQHARFAGTKISSNALMTQAHIRKHCIPNFTLGDLLQQAMNRLSLSTRAYDRSLKVARTIADLAEAEKIESLTMATSGRQDSWVLSVEEADWIAHYIGRRRIHR